MRSDEVVVSLENLGPTLDMIERTAAYLGYDSDCAATLRLLGEEMFQSCSRTLSDLQGVLWIDTDDANMNIHLRVEGEFSKARRARLMELSKSGRNEKPKGIFARLGAFFDDVFMANEDGYAPLMCDYGMMESQYAHLSLLDSYWADQRIRAAAREEQDDLKGVEGAILKGLADDVRVSARPYSAELIIVKKLPDKTA